MDSNYISLEKDADLSTITTATVVDVVWLYITQRMGGVIGSEYAAPQGRITVNNNAAQSLYPDVAPSAWYYDAVSYVTETGLMNGVGDMFDPNANMTRGMFVTMLYRLAGSPEVEASTEFVDVGVNSWYHDAVVWAVAEGITTGTSSTTFAPAANMTRQEMATFIYRHFDKPEVTGELPFADSASVADWAEAATMFCYQNGYMTGTSNDMFSPNGFASRAMGATVLMRMHKG